LFGNGSLVERKGECSSEGCAVEWILASIYGWIPIAVPQSVANIDILGFEQLRKVFRWNVAIHHVNLARKESLDGLFTVKPASEPDTVHERACLDGLVLGVSFCRTRTEQSCGKQRQRNKNTDFERPPT
jgi:hypothetical protein